MNGNFGDSVLLLTPTLITFAGALFIMMAEAIGRPGNKSIFRGLALGVVAASAATTVMLMPQATPAVDAFEGMIRVDAYGLGFQLVALLAGAFSLVLSHEYLEKIGVRVGEYYALVLFSLFGMQMMAVASDLMMVFISLEVMSISMYVLCAMKRSDPKSVESGFKYFILGAFASGLLLYGIALLFGAAGSTNFTAIARMLSTGNESPLVMIGGALVIAGFGFKVGSVPFHQWVPDVYQGAPTSVTALMSAGVKVASFAAFGRLVYGVMGEQALWWSNALWAMAALTMVVGNVAALVQNDLKRVLAYSSVAHAGYLLMALAAVGPQGAAGAHALGSILFYALTYTIMSAGTFAILTLMVEDGADHTDISQLAGLGRSNPWLALGLSICLLSLAGIPPTMGFVGKFYLFSSAVQAGYSGLAIMGALGAAAGVYYYLRPMVYMYMKEGHPRLQSNAWVNGTVAVVCVLMFALGILPSSVLAWAEAAVRTVLLS